MLRLLMLALGGYAAFRAIRSVVGSVPAGFGHVIGPDDNRVAQGVPTRPGPMPDPMPPMPQPLPDPAPDPGPTPTRG